MQGDTGAIHSGAGQAKLLVGLCCAQHTSLTDRGVAIGAMAAKMYTAILEQRISDWAEASNFRAVGQFGFRRQRGTAQAALVLRALQDQHRLRGQQLWGCFVDCKQAYDRVPRDQLREKLAAGT